MCKFTSVNLFRTPLTAAKTVQSKLTMSGERTVEQELAFLKHATESRGKLATLLKMEDRRFDDLFADFQQYRPPGEMLRRWREIISSVRRMCWIEYSLKSMETDYFKKMLTATVKGNVPVQTSVFHLTDAGEDFKDYQGERRARLRAIVKVARDLGKICKRNLPDVRKEARKEFRRRRAVGETVRSEEEIYCEEMEELHNAFKKSVQAYYRI